MPTLYLQQLSKDDALIFFSPPPPYSPSFFLFGVYLTSVLYFPLVFSEKREREIIITTMVYDGSPLPLY